MFNLGFSELILLGIIALIFIGPQQLPEVARTIGRLLNELKRASNDFQDSFTNPIKQEIQNRLEDVRTNLNDEPPPPSPLADVDPEASADTQAPELPVGAKPVKDKV